MVSWILVRLLAERTVDAVLHVKPRHPTSDDPRLFRFGISRTEAEVHAGAKSRYYPVEMSEVLRLAREEPGRYAIVGLPCFVKAVRLLTRQDPVLAERIRYTVALFCGHLKSTRFADLFAWQLGVRPGELLTIDFRHKIESRNADKYGVAITGKLRGHIVTKEHPVAGLHGADWGAGHFKYHACEFCDDVVGETADISVGDAWLPEYVPDSRGTNVVIVRRSDLMALIDRGIHQGELALEALSAEKAIASQAAGFRHRREGLAYRLYLCDRQGVWHPPKRVLSGAHHLSRQLRRRYALRMECARASHVAFRDAVQSQSLQVFIQRMQPILRRYYSTYVPLWRRVARKLLNIFRAVVLRFRQQPAPPLC
jgi:coenzyme F420-reducing hydrogenase beta subunit